MIKRIYEVDPLECPECGGQMQVVSFIEPPQEDVIEEIVGDIFDESDLPMRDIHEQADGGLIVRARVDLRKLSAKLGVPWDPEIEPSTVGGLVTEQLERIPVVGDVVTWKGFRIEVLRADSRRAKLLRVSKD